MPAAQPQVAEDVADERAAFVAAHGDVTLLVCLSCGRRGCWDGREPCAVPGPALRPNVRLLAAADLEPWNMWTCVVRGAA